MKLHINNKLCLGDLQSEFNHLFPNLKLEFFTSGSYAATYETGAKLKPDTFLGDCKEVMREGELFVSEQERVAELEQELSLRFGLHAMVYRKQGDSWERAKSLYAKSLIEVNGLAA